MADQERPDQMEDPDACTYAVQNRHLQPTVLRIESRCIAIFISRHQASKCLQVCYAHAHGIAYTFCAHKVRPESNL